MNGRRLLQLLSAGLLVAAATFSTGRAEAVSCVGARCVRYWADLTLTAWTTPSITPVSPGSTHTYTVQVTNTGWRTGGIGGPTPAPGPDSGPVYVAFQPSSPDEFPVGHTNDSGVPFRCQGYYSNGLACDTSTIATDSTAQFSVIFQAPRTPGTYTVTISVTAVNWTEYNPNNNTATLTYTVGYPV